MTMEERFPKPSLKELVLMDMLNYDSEKIGCHFKDKLLMSADFYNNSFHIYGGVMEKFLLNLSPECFDYLEGDNFECKTFYKVFSCIKQNVLKLSFGFSKFKRNRRECRKKLKGTVGKDRLRCMTKCSFESLNLSESDYFNSTIIGNWFEDKFPSTIGRVMKNKVEFCDQLVKIPKHETPTFNCKYFHIYSNCWIREIVKGLWNLTTITPKVKGFTIEELY